MAKVAKVAKIDKAALPQVRIERGDTVSDAPAEIARLLMAAWDKKLNADAVKKDYDDAADALKEALNAAGGPCSVVAEGVCRAIYTTPARVTVKHPETLEAVLGSRYLDLVTVDEKVTPTEALIKLASDADDPLGPAVAAALSIAHGESLKLMAEKPARTNRGAQ